MFIAKNEDLIILAKDTREELEEALKFMVYTDIEETDIEYVLHNGEYLTPEQVEEKEHERIATLSLTRGDVFAGLIQARMIDENSIRTMIEQLPEETQEQKVTKMLSLNALSNALNFHRSHPLVDTMGEQLGISSANLDKFFDTNDYHFLLPEQKKK